MMITKYVANGYVQITLCAIAFVAFFLWISSPVENPTLSEYVTHTWGQRLDNAKLTDFGFYQNDVTDLEHADCIAAYNATIFNTDYLAGISNPDGICGDYAYLLGVKFVSNGHGAWSVRIPRRSNVEKYFLPSVEADLNTLLNRLVTCRDIRNTRNQIAKESWEVGH